MQNQILMIQTKDKRKYYTDFQNLPMLVEFVKTFGADLSLVESNEVETMDLEKLVPALCDDSYRTPRINRAVRVLHKLYPVRQEESYTRKEILQNARKIREHIKLALEKGDIVRIAEVKEKFRSLELTDSCLSNHMSVICKEMSKEGKRVIRMKMGVYRIEKP